MTAPDTLPDVPPRNLPRSALAIIVGFLAVAGLSLGTDQIMHVLNVYPPWGQPMFDTGDNVLALAYRLVYTVLGGYLAARLAPHSPMRHAIILGVIGTVLATAGAVVTITQFDLGPDWYPMALAVTALPCSWLGGKLYRGNVT